MRSSPPKKVEKEEIKEDSAAGPKKGLFGASKKNVFNPFAKKSGGPKPIGTGTGLGGVTNTSFTKDSNAPSEGKFSGSQHKSGGFGENSLTA